MLKPINDAIAKLKAETDNRIKELRRECKQRIARIEEMRRLIPILDAEGVPLNLYQWMDGSELTIDLGLMPTTKRAKRTFTHHLQVIRNVFGRLTMSSKSLADARKKIVRVCLDVDGYPNISVRYLTKLPKDAKCKIVRRKVRYTDFQLVCDL